MKVKIVKTLQTISIDKLQNKREEIIITEGLLVGQIFDSEDIENIKFGEGVDCYGTKPGFTKGFTKGFNS